MSELTLYLFDDRTARDWQPFALTRPAGELLIGAHTFRSRAELLFDARCAGHLSSPHLLGFDEPHSPRVIARDGIRTDTPRLFLSSRAIVDWGARMEWPEHTVHIAIADDVVGCYLPAGAPNPAPAWLDEPRAESAVELRQVPGRTLQHVWDLVAHNAAQVTRDCERRRAADGEGAAVRVEKIGYTSGALRTGTGVTIEPNVVLDFTDGPIWLDAGVTIRAFTRLAGPAYVGPRSTLLGGPFSGVSIGPVCRVHGEVEESVILGFSNKAHDGFLGHAYLGRWVNLGALTTNSDLKNNYGTIRMWTPAGDADTGQIKLGCLLGDHVKTGIGTMINTGTVIGAASNIFGGAMPPKHVPPFSWGSGADLVDYDIEKFLQVTHTVMKRRDVTLTEDMSRVLRAAWQARASA